MTQDISNILTRVDRAMMNLDGEAYLVLHRKAGERKTYKTLPGSSHARLAVESLVGEIETWLNTLPISSQTQSDFTFAASIKVDRKKKVPKWGEYRLVLDGLNVTRPASGRVRTAAEMMQGAKDRLTEVANNCATEAGPVRRWLIDGAGRQNTFVFARSAREAAWTFSALYTRDRREVREWRDTVLKITLLTKVYPPVDWIMHDPDAHNQV